MRSVIFGDNIYYSSDKSEIVNLFEVRNYDSKEHFITLILIGLLNDYSSNNRNQGFIELDQVYIFMQRFGFNPDQIDSCLNFMYSKGLFETSQKGNLLKTDDATLLIRATNLALYHINYLVNSFTYIDAILVDVPIFIEEFKGKIVNTFDIRDRLKRALVFQNYLNDVWATFLTNGSYFNWTQKSNELSSDIEQITAKVYRNFV